MSTIFVSGFISLSVQSNFMLFEWNMATTEEKEKIARTLTEYGQEQALAGSRFSIPGFSGRDFAESRDPGIFRDGIYPYFQSRDC